MPTLAIALKDLRLLLRDPRSAVILLLMPLVLVLILGLTLGEAFGRKPDHTLRISVVVEDRGLSPDPGRKYPPGKWSDVVLDDLADTGDIRVETIADRAAAERLVGRGDRAAVVVFGPAFSDRAGRCSFVGGEFKADPINPLHRDGVATDRLDVRFLDNRSQPVGAAVIRQVVQVSLMRVVIPYMIGQAFDLIGSDQFMDRMDRYIPGLSLAYRLPGFSKKALGDGIRKGIAAFFPNYNFTALSWADLTKDRHPDRKAENRADHTPAGVGLNRGAVRYQVLVPAYTVTFAFFLVLTVGWLFVAERRHGTLVRLRAAPLGRWQILVGKLLPCLLVSLFQGAFLLLCGKLVFGMTWGPTPWLLVPVVASTSAAAVGLAMLVAGVARTETQVAVYGTLLVLVLAGVSGSMLPREMMPEDMRQVARLTPHAWALDAYAQILNPGDTGPDVAAVLTASGVLTGFGVGFLLLAWWRMRLD